MRLKMHENEDDEDQDELTSPRSSIYLPLCMFLRLNE